MLMTGERQQLAHFVLQHKEERERILNAALLLPTTSGPLIRAYRWVIQNA